MMKYLKCETFKLDPEIKIVSLNRPEVKNAFHPEMISELTKIFQSFALEKNLKTVILKGEGTSFCAGADLTWMKEMVHYSLEENLKDSENLWMMFDAILRCPAPVIGVVQGAVYGGGLGLLACCDYVYAEPQAQFCFSEVRLGLAPAVISSFILRKINDAAVRPYMLSAEVFKFDTALRMGLVHGLLQSYADWQAEAKKFSDNGTEALRETKKLLNELSMGLTWDAQKKLTTQVISERRMGAEAQARLKKYIK